MHHYMTKQSSCIRCKECKEVVEGDLRDHWNDQHGEKLREIDHWLEKWDDKVKDWERVVRRQKKGEENESKQD